LELFSEAVDALELFSEAADALELLAAAVETLASAALAVLAGRAILMSSQSQAISLVLTQPSSVQLMFGSQVLLHMLNCSCFL